MSLEFISICANNRLNEAKTMWAQGGVDLGAVDNGKQTALNIAASRGHLEMARWLIEVGSPLENGNIEGRAALSRAANNDHVEVMGVLKTHGADLEQTDRNGLTPLSVAVNRRQETAARFLLERGANVNAICNLGRNALHYAVQNGMFAMTELLLANGVNAGLVDMYGLTPLDIAKRGRDSTLVGLLEKAENSRNFEHSVKSEKLKNSGKFGKPPNESPQTPIPPPTILNTVIANVENVEKVGAVQSTDDALMQKYPDLISAVQGNNLKLAEHYIKNGANVNQIFYDFQNNIRKSIMSIAIERAGLDIVKLLADAGVDINERFNRLDPDFKNDVADLIISEDFNPTERLFPNNVVFDRIKRAFQAAGRDINEELRPQFSPYQSDYMIEAIDRRKTDVIRFLMEHGFDIAAVPDGREKSYYLDELVSVFSFHRDDEALATLTPLFVVESENFDIFAIKKLINSNTIAVPRAYYASIISKCADINEQDDSGQTLLHYALSKYFLRKNSEKNQENPSDFWISAILDRDEVDVNIADYEERPPLYFACTNATDEIVRRLLRMGANPAALCGRESEPLIITLCRKRRLDIMQTFSEFGADFSRTDAKGNTALHLACLSQDREMLGLLLGEWADVNAADKYGDTPLFSLLQKGLSSSARGENTRPKNWRTSHVIEMLDMLLNAGADVDSLNYNLQTPLFVCAANEQNLPLCKHLIQAGAAVDTADSVGNTCLHYAVSANRMAIARFLLENGADPNAKNNSDETPYSLALKDNRRAIISLIEKFEIRIDGDDLDAAFMRACKNGARGVAETLIKQGNIDVTYVDNLGRTPLHYVAAKGMVALAKFLIEHGVDVNYRDMHEQTALHFCPSQKEVFKLLIEMGADVNIADDNGVLPIHLVANRGQHDLLQLLLENGAEPAVTDRGETLLHVAAYTRSRECARVALAHGIDPNQADSTGVSPLIVSVAGNQKEIAKMLLAAGAAMDGQDTNGNQGLHIAVMRGFKDMLALLLEYGADVNALNNDGFAPLHLAAHHGYKDIFKFLLDKNADSSLKTGLGKSCIDIASENNHRELLELIAIREKRRPTTPTTPQTPSPSEKLEILEILSENPSKSLDSDGNTALHMAALQGNTNEVKRLLSSGTDPNAANNNGVTPLHLAAYIGNADILRILIQHGADTTAKTKAGRTWQDVATENNHTTLLTAIT
ncbi:MAG: ankyrin repeat domain-containing protein [Turicibacter sp.]|nr:ankyrin repeat domain-containing protein [Turicibacter sp.]